MPEYKRLEEMKIKNPLEIERYSVQTIEHDDEHTDVLRIVYKRKRALFCRKASVFVFPESRKQR